jgi:hypothetical protein
MKEVGCPTGFVCPTPEKSVMSIQQLTQHTPTTQRITKTFTFPGSEQGTPVLIEGPGPFQDYNIIELIVPPTPEGLVLVQSQVGDCQGRIRLSVPIQSC